MKYLFEIIELLLEHLVKFLLALNVLASFTSCEADYLLTKKEASSPLKLNVLHKEGNSEALRLLFLPEGYTQAEMGQFLEETRIAWEIISQTKPYAYCLDKIDAYYTTELASADTIGSGHTAFGLEMPGQYQASSKIKLDSIRNVMRRLDFPIEKTIFVILCNLRETSLGFTLLTAPDQLSDIPETVVIQSLYCKDPAGLTHELGHAVGLLGDEYYYSGDDLEFNDSIRCELLKKQTSGVFLNVSVDSSEVYWHEFLVDNAFPDENIGIYEGGVLFANGVWRSTYNSVMRYHFEDDFYSPLDRFLIYSRIEHMHSGRDVSYEEWKHIDLAYPQQPIDWARLLGRSTRSTEVDTPATPSVPRHDVILLGNEP